MKTTAFLCGVGLGMVAGAAVEMMIYPETRAMKRSVERTIRKAGHAIDHAAESITAAID